MPCDDTCDVDELNHSLEIESAVERASGYLECLIEGLPGFVCERPFLEKLQQQVAKWLAANQETPHEAA